MALGLQNYDFLVSTVDKNGKSSTAVAEGRPIYAIPLTQCWTKARAVQDCWPVAKALMEASARNPDSMLLKADSTWLCLHLAFDKQTGAPKKSARETFFSNIPKDLDEVSCKNDFDTLALELGQEVMNSLHLAYDSYKWAREVLNQYGMIFMGENGDKVDVLVPGVELFKKAADSEVAPKPADVRLETKDANFSEPTVVIYAKKSFVAGDDVHWHSMRQHKSSGVPWVVKFPYADCGKSVMDNLCSLLGGSLNSKVGDSCPAEDDAPVQVIMEEGKSMVNVTLHLTKEKPLPGKDVMSLIGVGILADPSVLASCMKEEATIPGVMEEDQCDKRALRILKPELSELSSQASSPQAKQVLEQAMGALQTRLSAEPERTSQSTKSMKELLSISHGTATTIEWPEGTDKAVETLKASTKELGSTSDMRKINLMQTCLKSTIFGDPAAMPLSVIPSENATVNAYSEAAKAEMAALARCLEAEAGKAADKALKAQTLSKLGALQVRMNEFADALKSFQQSLQAGANVTTATMALECAQAIHAQAEPKITVDADFKGTLQLLKKELVKMGFTAAAVPTPTRRPTSLPVALASMPAEPDSILAQALSVSSEVSELVELVRFFMLHRPMPVKKVRLLLGAKVCNGLLHQSLLTCFDPITAKAVSPADAKKLVSEPKSRGAQMIFSNIALQPMDGLVVASDFDYGLMLPGRFEPEPYLAQDTAALAASVAALQSSSSVQRPGSKTLADSIPAGVAASSSGAKVCFAGSKRFQQFATLSAHLNGFEDCQFVDKTSEKFDLVLSSVVRLPNPGMAIGAKGPMFKDGMKDSWTVSLQEGIAKLNASGSLVMTSLISNAGASCKSKCEKVVDAGHRAAVFTSKPSKAEDLLIHLATGCAQVHHYAYMTGLQKEGVTTMSEAVIVAWKRPAGATSVNDDVVEMMPESKALWTDVASLKTGVQGAYESLCQNAAVQEMMRTNQSGEEIYSFNWDEDNESTTDSEKASKGAVPTANPWTTSQSRKAVARKVKQQERNVQFNGARWDEVGHANVMGWASPINLYSTWRVSPYPQRVPEAPAEFPPIAIVQMEHVKLPSDFMDAMRDTFDCKTKFVFSTEKNGEKKKFTPVTAGRSRRRRRGISEEEGAISHIDQCPIVIVPIPPTSYDDKPIVDLPLEMVYFAQYFADKVRDGAELLIILLTCNAFGPVMEDFSDTVSRAGALTGMSRTLRLEVRGLTIWNVDLDNFKPKGDSMEVMAQLSLEINCPDHNSEICWREGKRFIRSFELSARNPIRGPAIGPVFPWLQDEPNGVVFITGGTGGLGVVSAEALAQAGATNIVLCSRSGKVTAQGQGLEEMIERINQMPGVKCIMEKCDTSQEQQVMDALERTRKNVGPIKVIIHGAGVLADTILDFQNEETMNKSFNPKADGAWFLHKHSLIDDLTSFVCFSSVSSLMGNPGQVNYSSSNAYMDTLCRMRVHKGLPGIALMWPAVAEVGMAASGILKGVEFDENQQVKPDVVKTVMRLCCCNTYPLEPLIAVAPIGCFWPSNPSMALLTEPLFNFYRDPKAFDAAVKQAESSDAFKGVVASVQGGVNPGAARK